MFIRRKILLPFFLIAVLTAGVAGEAFHGDHAGAFSCSLCQMHLHAASTPTPAAWLLLAPLFLAASLAAPGGILRTFSPLSSKGRAPPLPS